MKKTKKPTKTIKTVKKKTAVKNIEPKKESYKEHVIYYCPICNSTFVQKIVNSTNGAGTEQIHFICHHCGHKADTFPEIEASKIANLKPAKHLSEIKLPDGTKPIQYDPFKFILGILIGIILIIFGAYITYLSLTIASMIYTILMILGGIFLIMGTIKYRKQHGTKK